MAEIQCRAVASVYDMSSGPGSKLTTKLPPRYLLDTVLRGLKQARPKASQTFAWGAHSSAITVHAGMCKKTWLAGDDDTQRDVCVSAANYSRGKFVWHFKAQPENEETDVVLVR